MIKTTSILTGLLLAISGIARAEEGDSQISFCNESLPLHEPIVVKYFEQALIRSANPQLVTIKNNAPQFFSVIEPILAQYQVPSDFKYLCIAESALDSKAMSHKGACGFWQFMPETARAMGLIVNDKVDERKNLRKSTTAACRYFRQLYHELGSWTLVAAAYNAGPTKMKEYAKINGKRNFYQWSVYSETRKYLYRVIALKEMLLRPDIYENVVEENIPLRVFLRGEGILLGLMTWPINPGKTAIVKREEINKAFFHTLSESIVSGFKYTLPLAFKRYTFSTSQTLISSLLQFSGLGNTGKEEYSTETRAVATFLAGVRQYLSIPVVEWGCICFQNSLKLGF